MDLEHCPFCGVKPHHVDGLATDSGARDRIGKYAWIECGCGARGPDVRVNYGDVDGWQDKVTDEWNTRAPDAAAFAAGAEAMREVAADAMECSCSRDWNAGQRCTATGYGVLGGLCSRIARDKIRAIPLPKMATSDCPRKERT